MFLFLLALKPEHCWMCKVCHIQRQWESMYHHTQEYIWKQREESTEYNIEVFLAE